MSRTWIQQFAHIQTVSISSSYIQSIHYYNCISWYRQRYKLVGLDVGTFHHGKAENFFVQKGYVNRTNSTPSSSEVISCRDITSVGCNITILTGLGNTS